MLFSRTKYWKAKSWEQKQCLNNQLCSENTCTSTEEEEEGKNLGLFSQLSINVVPSHLPIIYFVHHAVELKPFHELILEVQRGKNKKHRSNNQRCSKSSTYVRRRRRRGSTLNKCCSVQSPYSYMVCPSIEHDCIKKKLYTNYFWWAMFESQRLENRDKNQLTLSLCENPPYLQNLCIKMEKKRWEGRGVSFFVAAPPRVRILY